MLVVALCAASISYTVCYASLFLWLREWVSKFHSKLEELIHCPYCFCHYVILTIMLTTDNVRQYLFDISGYLVYDFLFTWFCIVCVTSLLHCVMLISYRPIMEYMAHRKIEKWQRENKNKVNSNNKET